MSTTPAPGLSVKVQPATARWTDWIKPGLVEGEVLVHTDVTTQNFLITERTSRSWTGRSRAAAQGGSIRD